MRLSFLRFIMATTISLLSLKAQAEYRAFSLLITDTKTGQTRTVQSNLDHIQYRDYYLVHQYETVTIQDSWMCWGRTGDFKAICPNPRGN
jgi:hypothetical protein